MDIGNEIVELLRGAWYIAQVIILIGILVVAHEYGHFIAAKLTGMRVDEFAVGFGKRLFSWQRGETLYAINLVPIGGYNKIYGMDVEEPEEEKKRLAAEKEAAAEKSGGLVPQDYSIAPANDPRAFVNRPLWSRFLVVISGPIANIVAAVMIIFLMGVTVGFPAAELGEVIPGGPAAGQGFMKGDIITHLDGVRLSSTDDLHRSIALSNGNPLRLAGTRDSEEFTTTIIPQTIRLADSHLCRLGFIFLNDGFIVSILDDSPAERAGLEFGDSIIRVDGTPFPSHMLDISEGNGIFHLDVYRGYSEERVEIEYFDSEFNHDSYNPYGFTTDDENLVTFVIEGGIASDEGLAAGDRILESSYQPEASLVEGKVMLSKSDFMIIFERDGQNRQINLKADTYVSRIQVLMNDASEPVLVNLPYDHRLALAGISSGDEIKSIEGITTPNGITAFLEFQRHLGQGVAIVAMSEGQERVFEVPMPPIESNREIQEFFNGLHFRTSYFRADPISSMGAGINKTKEITSLIYMTLGMLFTGQASVSDLSGPVMIANITYAAASNGLVDLVHIMVLLSVNLAIFNLLPFPALDGGRILFMIPEAILRRPIVTVRVENIIHITGFLLLIMLAVFVTYHDVVRLFFSN